MFKFFSALVAIGLLGYLVWNVTFNDPTVDPRSSIQQNISEYKKNNNITKDQEELLRLQFALRGYISSKGNPPSSLGMLVPEYIDTVPKDPKTDKPYRYVRNGNRYKLGEEMQTTVVQVASVNGSEYSSFLPPVDSEDAKSVYINPNEMVIEDFRYDSTDLRDPFRPFDMSKKKKSTGNPLQDYALSQLRVTAIITDLDGDKKAIVEDSSSKGYTVVKGTKIGNQDGVVVEIKEDRVNVLEVQIDLAGRKSQRVVEMKIYTATQ